MEHHRGFTLIELSIVVVIIGLIVSGVVAGQSLVRQAQLRSVVSEVGEIQTAYNAFLLQYNALPGDIINARSFWTSCGSSDAECNGDGNRAIENPSSTSDNEAYRFWQHLSLAGLYSGSFTGVGGGTGQASLIGVNAPAAAIAGANYNIRYDTNSSQIQDLGGNFDIKDRNYLWIAAPLTDLISYGYVFTPAEALAMDLKMDDGMAVLGKVFSEYGAIPGSAGTRTSDACLSGTITNASYALSVTVKSCFMEYSLD